MLDRQTKHYYMGENMVWYTLQYSNHHGFKLSALQTEVTNDGWRNGLKKERELTEIDPFFRVIILWEEIYKVAQRISKAQLTANRKTKIVENR